MGRKPSLAEQTKTEQGDHLASSVLRVFLLGPPIIGWGESTLSIPRRQARALLYRLAAHLQPVPREQLCFLFWPDIPETNARRNLTRLLTALRSALPIPDIVRVSEERIGLDLQRAWSDTVACERSSAIRQSPDRREMLERAVELYRGPFLSGFSLPGSPEFEAWVEQEQRAWERLYLEGLAALTEIHRQRATEGHPGEYEAAIACARRYLANDDLAEEVHRQLIELYAAVGDRSAAVRQFEHCVTVLERELGVSPLPETQAAFQATLGGHTPALPRPAQEPAELTLPDVDLPLVGREHALRQLEEAYQQASAGHGQVILVSGEPGIGKTRLLEAFITRLQNRALILKGAGRPGSQTLPFQPIVEALRSILDFGLRIADRKSKIRNLKSEISPVWLSEVTRLLPELRTRYPDLPPPLPAESEEARTRLFEALCQLALGLAAGPLPVLLCLDDLHWADPTTLEWLAYLGGRLQGRRLLVLATFLDEEADTLSKLRQALGRSGALAECKLTGLDTTEVLRLLDGLLGPAVGSRGNACDRPLLAERLQSVTGGNPFFLLETVRLLAEVGRISEKSERLADLPLPDTVRAAVHARLARLSGRARQVLEAAAVLGSSFGFDLVCLTAGRGEMETLDSLEALVAKHLLVECDGAYQFHHEFTMTAVYGALGYWRRRLLHRRAGEALEKLHPDDTASLAWHFERGEQPAKAARYALQAGNNASRVFAYAEAGAFFARALRLLKDEAAHCREPSAMAANQRMQIQVLTRRGWMFRLLGDMEAYMSDLEEEARLVALLGETGPLASLRWREAAAHRWFCRYPQALEAAEEGVRLSREAGDALLEARCHRETGLSARAVGDFPRAEVALKRALQLFVELGETVYEIHTLGNLSTLYRYLGEYEQAMTLAYQALTRCEQAGLSFQRRLPLGDLGAAALGDADQARTWLQESLDIARQTGDRTQEIFCLGHLGGLFVRLNHPAEALEYLLTALSLAERLNSRAEQSQLHSGLAEAHHLSGEREQAILHAHRALELAQAYGRVYDQEKARQILARLESL